MTAYVGAIIFGGPQLIRSSKMGISGLSFLLMFVQRLELVSNAKVFWKVAAQIFPFETYGGFWTFLAVGP
jgi:hypothetical protein